MSAPLRVGVLASGRGSNLQALLEAALAHRIPAEIVVVISDVPGCRALERARDAGVPAVALPPAEFATRDAFDAAALAHLNEHEVQLVCNAGFRRIVGPVLLTPFAGRYFNIHPSLLPAFRGLQGLAVHRAVLAHGVKVSGCTVHIATDEVDNGPIVIQRCVPVEPGDTPETLAARVLAEEHRAYPDAVRLFAEGRLEIRGRQVIIRPEEN